MVAGAAEPEARRAIRLAERVSEHVYAHESSADMQELMDRLSHAMGQLPLERLSTS